ncbi:hypothetical protein [Massilia sp. H6]|uniref:hypothetical protein n=1 Tax=Massilia sp. H6 TaxID=2970464 RepID=UPI0021687C12|nr:hypothetical protein [Massilia sp. H6]UVW29896.1 hypothetical protein NRS07_07195 [Massilia sp. H6]
MRLTHATACVCLLSTAGLAAAQVQPYAPEWASYRDAYRAMVVFEKYGGAKNLLQNHLQLVPRAKGVLADGIQLALTGKTVRTSLTLDALGRTVLPLVKAAYDENAVLAPNRRLGGFTLRARVSIATQPDNTYETADLRSACEQALAYARHVDASARSQRCEGVRMVFAKHSGDISVRLRGADGEQPLQLVAGPAFAGDAVADLPGATYRFSGESAQLVTYGAPLAIVPLFE